MFEEALSLLSTWTSMSNWFTPTFLFLFLNFMIATIFFTSSLQPHQPQQQQQQQQQLQQQQQQLQQQSSPSQITRAPSLLHRLKSINFYSHPSTPQTPSPKHKPEPEPVSKSPDRVRIWASSINEDKVDDDGEGPTLDEIYSRIKGISPGHSRQKSDTLPFSGDIPVKLPAKIRKSASDKSAFNHFEAAEEVVETENVTAAAVAVAEATVTTTSGEVDAMADDFISRFKKQLQLQRVESIMRYKDMITRGSAK